MENKRIALVEGIGLITLMLIAFFKDSILMNLPLISLFKYGGETLFYLKLGVFSLCTISIIEYFFLRNSTETFFSAKGGGFLAMILVIIFGFYFKKLYIVSGVAFVSFLIYCFACIACQGTSCILMINNKFHRAFKMLNGLAIIMTINVISILAIKLLKLLDLIEKSYIYIAEKTAVYIVGLIIVEIIAYIIFVFKEKPIYFEKVGAISMVLCSILIFVL